MVAYGAIPCAKTSAGGYAWRRGSYGVVAYGAGPGVKTFAGAYI